MNRPNQAIQNSSSYNRLTSDSLVLHIPNHPQLLEVTRQIVQDRLSTPLPRQTSLLESLHQLYFDHSEPICLCFDQFEDFRSSGDLEQIQKFEDFVQELAKRKELDIQILLNIGGRYRYVFARS